MAALLEMNSKRGIKNIQTQYKEMLKNKDSNLWAKEFSFHARSFALNTADFEPNNLKALFEFYHKNKVQSVEINHYITYSFNENENHNQQNYSKLYNNAFLLL